jgi:hypothetical protein
VLEIVLSGSNHVREGSSWGLVHSSYSAFKSRVWYLDELVLAWGSKLDNLFREFGPTLGYLVVR